MDYSIKKTKAMVQFSFYLFLLNIFSILYLMTSGEEYSRNYANIANTNFAFMKVQFLVMAMCYIGLAYSCLAYNDVLVGVIAIIKAYTSILGYSITVLCYVAIHVLWASHFIDLCFRAHVFNHSKSGRYSTAITRILNNIIHSIFKTNP